MATFEWWRAQAFELCRQASLAQGEFATPAATPTGAVRRPLRDRRGAVADEEGRGDKGVPRLPPSLLADLLVKLCC